MVSLLSNRKKGLSFKFYQRVSRILMLNWIFQLGYFSLQQEAAFTVFAKPRDHTKQFSARWRGSG